MKNLNILICLAVLFMGSCSHEEQGAREESTFRITSPIVRDTLIYNSYVCQIRSIQHIELRALEKGYLQNIYVDEGQHVKQGQLLFQIMPIVNQAEVLKSKAEVSFAEIEYQNTKNLSDSNIVSKNELALAKATLEKAKAELALAQAHLSFTEIHAPFDGIVGRFNDVRKGSLVDEGDLLTQLSDNDKMWVYFNVPEAEYLEYAIRPKTDTFMKVKLQLANNKLFDMEGIVETIEADFNNETGNIAFRATFQNTSGLLRNGETGSILMPLPLKNVLLIPQMATYEVLDKKFVFVVGADNVVKAREIKIGREVPHLYSVVSGLTKNDKILVDGLRKVKNNQKIKCDFVELPKILADLEDIHAE